MQRQPVEDLAYLDFHANPESVAPTIAVGSVMQSREREASGDNWTRFQADFITVYRLFKYIQKRENDAGNLIIVEPETLAYVCQNLVSRILPGPRPHFHRLCRIALLQETLSYLELAAEPEGHDISQVTTLFDLSTADCIIPSTGYWSASDSSGRTNSRTSMPHEPQQRQNLANATTATDGMQQGENATEQSVVRNYPTWDHVHRVLTRSPLMKSRLIELKVDGCPTVLFCPAANDVIGIMLGDALHWFSFFDSPDNIPFVQFLASEDDHPLEMVGIRLFAIYIGVGFFIVTEITRYAYPTNVLL